VVELPSDFHLLLVVLDPPPKVLLPLTRQALHGSFPRKVSFPSIDLEVCVHSLVEGSGEDIHVLAQVISSKVVTFWLISYGSEVGTVFGRRLPRRGP